VAGVTTRCPQARCGPRPAGEPSADLDGSADDTGYAAVGLGEVGQFAGDVVGLDRADPLEDFQRLPQEGLGPGGVTGGQGAAAQAGQCVRLVPGAG
jgi:hypothetical protein